VSDSTSRRATSRMTPGTPLGLAWGDSSCRGEAIVVGSEHALVLARESLTPGTHLELRNDLTGDRAHASVVWCSPADASGLCKIGLQIVDG